MRQLYLAAAGIAALALSACAQPEELPPQFHALDQCVGQQQTGFCFQYGWETADCMTQSLGEEYGCGVFEKDPKEDHYHHASDFAQCPYDPNNGRDLFVLCSTRDEDGNFKDGARMKIGSNVE